MRPVTAGRTIANRTVIEQGVTAGERIVTDGMGKLAPGSKVAIKETPAVKNGDAPRQVDAKGGTTP
jgi:multidrug efflux system membrane fusion protein